MVVKGLKGPKSNSGRVRAYTSGSRLKYRPVNKFGANFWKCVAQTTILSIIEFTSFELITWV